LRGIQAADSGGSMIQHWRRCSGAATKPPCQWRGHILSISSDGGSCKAQPLAIRGGTNGWVRTDQSVRWTTRASARGAANRMADIHDAYLVEHVVAMFAAWFERQACQSVARSRRVNRARDIRPADGWRLERPSCFGAPFRGREAALREDGRTPTPVRRLPRLVSHAALAQEAVCKSNGTPHMHSCRKPQTTCRRARVRNQSPRPSIVQHAASNADPHRDLPPGARLGLGRANFRPGRWVAKGPQARR